MFGSERWGAEKPPGMRGCSDFSAAVPAARQLSARWRRSLMHAGQTRTPPPVASFIQPYLLQVARQTRHFRRAPPPPLSKQSVNHFAPRYEASPKKSTSRARSLDLASRACRFFYLLDIIIRISFRLRARLRNGLLQDLLPRGQGAQARHRRRHRASSRPPSRAG